MSEGRSREARRTPRSVWVLLMLFVVVTIASVVWALGRFESRLTDRAQAALDDAGLAVTVVFEGRDAVLDGSVGSQVDIDRAVQVVTEIRGVHTVVSRGIEVVSVPPTTTTSPPVGLPSVVEIAFGDGQVTLAGLVTPQGRDRLFTAAEAAFGAGNVDDRLQVDADVMPPGWLEALASALGEFGEIREGTIVAGDQGLTVSGVVSSAEAVDGIGIRLAQVTGLQVTNQLSFIEPVAPSLSAVASNGTLTLGGELPTQEDIDAIVSAAMARFDAVENGLVVGAVDPSAWIEFMPSLVGRLASWSTWNLTVNGDVATIGGFAPGTEELDAVAAELAATGLEWDLDALEVDPEALAGELTQAIAGRINFSSGSAALTEDSTDVLDRVIEALLRNPSAILQVEGHTDDQGTAEANLELSTLRAQAVVDYLVAGGIEADRLSATGRGESEPIADNGTEEGRAQNRRIEFVVVSEGVNG